MLYRFEVAGIDANVNWDVSYLKNYDVRPFPGGDEINYAGMITGGSGSFAHWRSFGSLTLVEGPWSGSYSLQYRSEEHTSELQSLMRNSYAVFCLKKKNNITQTQT